MDFGFLIVDFGFFSVFRNSGNPALLCEAQRFATQSMSIPGISERRAKMRNTIVVLAVAAVVALAAAPAGAYVTWSGSQTGYYDVGSNWDGGFVPGEPGAADNRPYIQNGGTCEVRDTRTATDLYVGYSSNVGHLNVLSTANFDAGSSMYVGKNASTTCVFTQSGGIFEVDSCEIGTTGNGKVVISGGDFQVGYLRIDEGSNGDATFEINGYGASNIRAASWIKLGTTGKMSFILKDNAATPATPVTPLYTHTTPGDYFSGVISVNDAGYTLVKDTIVTLVVADTGTQTLNTTSLHLDTTSDVNWDLITSDASKVQIKCMVPEPATLALLGIGGIGVLIRRKRR